ncbi:glycosyltransferase [Aquihabitans sp. McL0605]|uniref:glycosyltransferase n=1 Tax=Aquihabitans sp. McL0605 TaxID=3415671 RepID=UPI003CFA7BB0
MQRRSARNVPHIQLIADGSGEALSHLFSGFGLLHQQGRADVAMTRAAVYRPDANGSTSLRAVVDGDLRLAFDLIDGPQLRPDDLDWATTYFKRSYRSSEHGDDARVLPLGLNYPAYTPGDWRGTRAWWSLRSARPKTAKDAMVQIVRLNRPLSKVLSPNGGCLHADVETLEQEPRASEDPRIVMMTRVWDHTRIQGEKADQWREMNDDRARCVRAVREHFGSAATCGIAPSDYAQRFYPDCVIDEAVAAKPNYLRLMRAADIGVATAGLRGSNGWRLGEYLAASKCIVTEPLQSEVPGGFAEGTNHLTFEDPDQCVEQCTLLMEDLDRRRAMMEANQRYYRSFVRPDGEVAHALERAGVPLAPGPERT